MPDSEPGFWQQLADIAAWLTGELAPLGVRPVVMGGHALEFYTLGDYATGDVDMVCSDIAAAAEALQAAGFQREGWTAAGLIQRRTRLGLSARSRSGRGHSGALGSLAPFEERSR